MARGRLAVRLLDPLRYLTPLLVLCACRSTPESSSIAHSETQPAAAEASEALPRMVELGSESCASCRAMIPVLDELRERHAAELEVDFIDVWKFPERAKPFGVHVIPTQVFLAPDGSELARHQGFYSLDGIRERWADLGFPLN